MRADATRFALEAVRSAPTLLEAMHRGPRLDQAAVADAASGPSGETSAVTLLRGAIDDPADQLTAAIATLALGSVATETSARTLARLLDDGAAHLQDHLVWALGRGPLVDSALPRLTGFIAGGGFVGMLAQRTLQHWSGRQPDAVRSALEAALSRCPDPAGRATLVETLGLVSGAATNRGLRRVAADEDEAPAARAAAVVALGDRGRLPGRPAATPDEAPRPTLQPANPADDAAATRQVLTSLAAGTGPLASVATIALDDLFDLAVVDRSHRSHRSHPGELGHPSGRSRWTARGPGARGDGGLTVAQLFLHADVDGDLLHAGQGDTGGIATLLVQLGDALLEAQPAVRRVLTISRSRPTQGLGDLTSVDEPGHHYLSIPLWGPNVPAAQAWPLRIATGRGLRRLLRAAGDVDVLHLRMGDVATMVSAEVAAETGLPIVFTLAPDPNALVASRDAAGILTRANFGATDTVEHLLFRERLLRELQTRSAHLVLFPRPTLDHDMSALMDLDIDAEADRVSVVAEGVSMAAIDAAGVTDGSGRSPAARALAELDDLLAQLPLERRGLPLAISVGRLTGVKGMVTLVDAWANERNLRARCNLLVVGGDVQAPTNDEQQQLAAIDALLPLDTAASHGLLLPGHRPNATVATWLRAVREGRPGGAASGGVYVSASLKEEFGIAILEAMATGLVVVAPASGGPATYVTEGVTGILADTGSRDRLGEAISAALELALAPGADERAAAAQSMVRDRFGIETMATALAEVYHQVATHRAARRESTEAAS
ncbi:MAG: glycosyltransferase family 4 protein [Humibacillus sp.]|nr:glycosyltransferase family 4 protein [Humibacillus sp.]MDN5777491.1 glycosyltransferase family 4 protein [Humibacillus sp.]